MASVSFRGKLTFGFDKQEDVDKFVQHFHVGKEGSKSDWPEDYELGDYPFDTFKITDLKTSGMEIELSFDFTSENVGGMPRERFVEAIKEDFDSLAGIDTPEWYITRAVATPSQEGARRRRRRTTRKRKTASRKTRRR